MGIDKSRLFPYRGPLIGFTDHSLLPEGMITLPLTVGKYPRQATVQVQFLVMDIKSAHNIILGRTALHLLWAIPSTYYQMVKFLTPNRLEKVAEQQRTISVEELQEIPIDQEGLKTIKIGSSLVQALLGVLTKFLQENANVFTWEPEDMSGVPSEVISHELAIDRHTMPVRQKKIHLSPER
ncbi:uncharacterized protein LOC109823408 [Asparagus officinalis]|uniref:uncharacterized protein LOC109823408 n=1 Tax=Asparagus officinalis TaxID=4686 RepID=UPI00098E207A|nr:uncharacterized protein LOC109823408 [Asparagus officinalis]